VTELRDPRRDRAFPATVDQEHKGERDAGRSSNIAAHAHCSVLVVRESEGGLQAPILEHDESAQATTAAREEGVRACP
jgi:hypothetical protein